MIRMVFGIVIAVVATSIVLPLTVSAQNVQFQQTITPLDCTLTTLYYAGGTSTNTDCDPQPPQIDSVDINNGRPIITGKYDANNSLLFRVKFNNVWYVLGEPGSRLTSNGVLWKLDFSDLSEPFDEGTYEIVLEMIARDGETLGSSSRIEIDESDTSTPVTPTPGVVSPTTPSAPNTGFIQFIQSHAVASVLIAGIVGSVIGFVVYIIYTHRNVGKSEVIEPKHQTE